MVYYDIYPRVTILEVRYQLKTAKTYLLSARLNVAIFIASNHASFENRRVNLTAL